MTVEFGVLLPTRRIVNMNALRHRPPPSWPPSP